MSVTTAAPAPGEPNNDRQTVMWHPAEVPPANPDLRVRTEPAYLKHYHERFLPDIAKNGVLVPLIVAIILGVKHLVDGETRRRAALEAGLKEVPVYLVDGPVDPTDLEIIKFRLNKARLGMTLHEEITFYHATMKAKGWTQARLSKELNLNPGTVCKMLRVLDQLDDALRDKLGNGEGQLSLRAAYALCDVPKEKQGEFAALYLSDRWDMPSLERNCKIEAGKKVKVETELKLSGDGWKLTIDTRKYDVAMKEIPAEIKKRKDSPTA